MRQTLLILVGLLSLSCGSCGDKSTDPGDATPSVRIIKPLDSSAVAVRWVPIEIDVSRIPRIHSVSVEVDSILLHRRFGPPYKFLALEDRWQSATWHTIAVMVVDSGGAFFYSDTLRIWYLPDANLQALLTHRENYWNERNTLYAVTSATYLFDKYDSVGAELERIFGGDWQGLTISGLSELAQATPTSTGRIYAYGQLDSDTTDWRWLTGEPFVAVTGSIFFTYGDYPHALVLDNWNNWRSISLSLAIPYRLGFEVQF